MKTRAAIEKIYQGHPILLVGSGFSSEATNKAGIRLPKGSDLALSIGEAIGIDTKYPLDMISKRFLQDEKVGGEFNLFKLLKDRLIVEDISSNQKAILSLPWSSIYTTNYDNVVEIGLKKLGRRHTSYNCAIDNFGGKSSENIDILHLNGKVFDIEFKDFNRKVRLTRASYVARDFRKSDWFAKFSSDLVACSCLIIIGYSNYDLDIAQLLHENPLLKSKTYYIEINNLDPLFEDELSDFGTVFKVGMTEFASDISMFSPPTKVEHRFNKLRELKSVEAVSKPTGDDVETLFTIGEYQHAKQVLANSTGLSYAINRDASKLILSDLQEGKNRMLVHSDLGNGKSIIMEQVSSSLVAQGTRCVFLDRYGEIDECDLRYLVEIGADNFVLFVEDIYNHFDNVKKVVSLLPDVRLIATSRSAPFELAEEKVKVALGEKYRSYPINRLSENEINQFIEIIDENGLWQSFSKKDIDQKRYFIRKTCNSQIRDVITRLFEETDFIKNRLNSVFAENVSGNSGKFLAVALMLKIANFPPDLSLINAITGIDVYREREVVNNLFSMEFISNDSGEVRVKSSIFGRYFLNRIANAESVKKILISVIKRSSDIGGGYRNVYNRLFRDLARFSFVDQIFGKRVDSDFYKNFYDELKQVPAFRRDSQFWLQYAIGQLEAKNYDGARRLFETAYSHARNPDQKTKVDNHFARYLLESRISGIGYKDFREAFRDAHAMLISQARKEENKYYAYKVATRYLEYYENFRKNLLPADKDVIMTAAEEIVVEAEKVSSTITQYYLVENCILKLNQLIGKIERELLN